MPRIALALKFLVAAAAAVTPARGEVVKLWERTLAPPLAHARDLRFLSDRSLVLALAEDGVAEIALDPDAPNPRELVPGNAKGGVWAWEIAASERFLAVGAPVGSIVWRGRSSAERGESPFDLLADLDVQGDRALVLAPRRDGHGQFAPEGALAWLGSLDRGFADPQPVHFDLGGPGAPAANHCGGIEVGAVRFAPDGSFWVVPGVQPGVYHYSEGGRLLRTIDTLALGLEVDCARRSWQEFATSYVHRLAWLNQRKVVDDLVLLPAGPALLIRKFEAGRPRWDLVVLGDASPPRVIPLDLPAPNETAQAAADFRAGHLAVLVRALENFADPRQARALPAHLALFDLALDTSERRAP